MSRAETLEKSSEVNELKVQNAIQSLNESMRVLAQGEPT